VDEQLAILLIDDDTVDRMAVRRTLRAAGLNVALTEASDHAGALAVLAEREYDCILLDYRLPDMDGLAVLRDLRERGITAPVVMLTGQGDEQLAVEIMKAGALDYLTKGSLTPEYLAQSVRNAVRLHRAERAASRALSDSIARLRLLAEASQQLASSLDTPTIVEHLGRLVVPALADWWAIDLRDSAGTLERVATHGDPDPTPPADLDAFWPLDAEADHGVPEALRAGRVRVYPEALPDDPAIRERWDALGLTAALAIPLSVRERTLGGITLVMAGSRRSYDAATLVLAGELAQRAAIALDNSYLFHQAQEAIRVRDEFLAVASHEFKNPLTTLLGNAQLLERRLQRAEHATDRDRRSVATMVTQAERLTRMVSSLLDVSRLQSGRFALQWQEVEVRDLLRRLVDEVGPTLTNHKLLYRADAEPLVISGDDLRLYEVFQNLLQNAIKYSPEGGPVTITAARSRSWATVAVRDEGIGIPQDAMPHLGRRYYRATNAYEQRLGGVGLGLYVVNQIIALHGGSIEVTSREGEGSTFTVRIPLLTKEETTTDEE
jgi:signal transduction histidine kinase/FixJ family two-component response regulator